MNLKTLLFTLTLAYMHTIFAFTTKIDKIITTDNKKITCLADAHNRSVADKEQMLCILNFLQQNEESTGTDFHILLEQASPSSKLHAAAYQMLYNLDGYIKRAQPQLTHVNLENIEIRHIAGTAYDILQSDAPYNFHKKYQNVNIYNSEKTTGTITFQDIVDEFTANKNALSEYFVKHSDETMNTIYTQHMHLANKKYEKLQQQHKISDHANTPIFDYAKKQYRYKTLETSKKFAKTIHKAFSNLLDLHILRTILTSKNNNIILIAGGHHTSNILPMLQELKASSVYSEDNGYELVDATREDGTTEQRLQTKAVTTTQILQGLSDNPATFIAKNEEIITENLEYMPSTSVSDMCCALF